MKDYKAETIKKIWLTGIENPEDFYNKILEIYEKSNLDFEQVLDLALRTYRISMALDIEKIQEVFKKAENHD